MRLTNWFKRRQSPSVWAIKQQDGGLLHLCGKAIVKGKGNAAEKLRQIQAGRFSGPIRMQENGAVLNSSQFTALAPEQELTLLDNGQAQWQGQRWQVAWVPQRCWLHKGRLTPQKTSIQGQTRLISIECVSGIRAKAEGPPRNNSSYTSLEAIEPPRHWHLFDKDNHTT